MKPLRLLTAFILLVLTYSCTNRSSVLPTVSGRPGDLLIVIEDQLWESEAGDSIRNIFEQDIVGLPWDEPLFDISRVSHVNYVKILQTARSIIDIEVSKTYTQPKVRYQKDLYAKTQRYIKVQLPDRKSLEDVLDKEGNRMISYLYQGERERYLMNYRKFKDEELMKRVRDSTGISMIIPTSFSRQDFSDDFLWMASRSNEVLQYLAIYTYDYTDQNQLTKERLIEKRNEVMKEHIPGSTKGSFMSTGTFYPPVLKEFTLDGKYVAEMRGIWETEGDMMGGPFVSQTRIDEKRNKVVTVEAFVYAPNQKKRNAMRQMESLFYTIKLNEDKKLNGGNGSELAEE